MDRNENYSTDESADEDDIFRNFDDEAQLIIQTDLLPKKSGDRYTLVYNTFKNWETQHKNLLSSSAENNLIVYFKDLKSKLKPPTLWSIWSMLKKTLSANDGVDITRFLNLKTLLSNNAKGYKPKKSAILKWKEIEKFLTEACDFIYLASKVILILGICGALRCDELTNLQFHDVEDGGDKFIVSVKDTKTYIDRQFIVGSQFYSKVKKYTSLRPIDNPPDRFFLNYIKGKCVRQVIGKNKIGEVPKVVATYLNLSNPTNYTGHCFRRTAATLLSDSGASVQMLKQLGGWRSEKVALGYVENSMRVKQNIYQGIVHASSESGISKSLTTAKPSSAIAKPSSVSAPSSSTASTSKTQPIHINTEEFEVGWDDFCEEFEIPPQRFKTSSPTFATAAGQDIVIPDISSDLNLELENPQTTITLAALDSKGPTPLQTRASTSSGFRSAASVAEKQHFFEKAPVKLKFSDVSEPAEKKKKIDSAVERATIVSSTLNNKTFDLESASFDQCVFHNCTFNFLPKPST